MELEVLEPALFLETMARGISLLRSARLVG